MATLNFFPGLSHRELKQNHKEELEKLENSYKEALKAEKVAAQEKLGTVRPMAMGGAARCLTFLF